jgi:signal transduction histidine kinase
MTVVAAPSLPRSTAAIGRELAVGTAVAIVIVATFALAPISGPSPGAIRLESAARLAVVGIPAAVGLYAWRSGPFQRLGALLVASSVVWLVVSFALADRALVYSIGRVADWVGWAGIIYLVLAFPEGRLQTRIDRGLARITGLLLVGLWLPTALLVERYPTPGQWVTCLAGCPHNAFMALSHEPAIVANVLIPTRELLTVVVFLAVVVRLVQRIAAATRIRRRALTPVLAVAVAGIALEAGGLMLRRVDPGSPLLAIARWVVAFALPAVALAFLVGLMRWHLYVGGSLRRLAVSLSPPGDPEALRAAFADAFDDPALAIVYPVAEGRWAGADGRPVDVPVAGAGRAMTDLRDPAGNVVATLVHDEALEAEAAFVNAIGSYATLSLENQRLVAEVAGLVHETRETQARAAATADQTREEIERDLHDGAQQRLIALLIKLRIAADHSDDPAPEIAERLNRLGADVQLAIDEMRALARGVFPHTLNEFGPVAALRETARSAPIPTNVRAGNVGRHPHEIERAVYFCCLEALQNTYKHATSATSATVTIGVRGRQIGFEVTDNGSGFDPAIAPSGAGLKNIRDRVAALDGSVAVDSALGHGTRVTGAIPLTATPNQPVADAPQTRIF